MLVLHEDPSARPAGRHAGLYHVALLFATRAELARVAVRIAVSRTPIQGASDHGTHEAIYLPDPDGNGLELAWDRDRSVWPSYEDSCRRRPAARRARICSPSSPARTLRRSRRTASPSATCTCTSATRRRRKRFYRDGLGFEVQADLGTAVFVSAGGYHHHVGFNVWRGRDIPAQPEGTVGFGHWTLVVPERISPRCAGACGPIGAPVSRASGRACWRAILPASPSSSPRRSTHERTAGQHRARRAAPRPIDPGVRVGHVHLARRRHRSVRDFYVGVLGFDVVSEARDVPGWGTTGDILFLSAGGYHHHLGFNTWKSAGGGPQPDGVAGLHHVALNYPTQARRSRTSAGA